MRIPCRCDSCGKQFKVPARLAGSKARCPRCKSVFVIPTDDVPPRHPIATDRSVDAIGNQSGVPVSDLAEPTGPTPDPSTEAVPRALPISAESTPFVPVAKPAEPTSDRPSTVVRVADVVTPTLVSIAESGEFGIESRQASLADRVSGKRLRRRFISILLGAMCVMLCVAALVLLLSWLALRSSHTGKLIILIPHSERAECVVLVDDRKRELNRVGNPVIRLNPGSHKLEIRRLGYDNIVQPIEILVGQELEYHPVWEK